MWLGGGLAVVSNQILWVDTETTGLDPERNGIIEIAGIFQYPGQRDQKSKRFETMCDPGRVELHPKALEVNGIKEEDISTFQPIDRALANMDTYVEPWCVIAGWNCAGFDIPFMKAAYKRAGIKWRFHYHCLDMMVVANWLKFCGRLNCKSLSLQNVAKYLGINTADFGDAHRAMPDVLTTVAIAKVFRDQFLGGMKIKV